MGATHDETWLMGQVAGAWGTDPRGGAQYSIAVKFHCANAMYVDTVAWYATDTNTAHKPTHMDVYDGAGNTIWTSSTVPHDGTVGWQNLSLGGSLALYSGNDYRISACFPATCPEANQTYVSTTPTPLGTSWGNPVALQSGPGNCLRPDAGQNDQFRGLDVHFTNPAPVPGTGASLTEIDADVAGWLSANPAVNDHPTDLPWATKAELDTVATQVADIQSKGNGVNGWAAIKAVADTINSAVSGLPGTIAGYFASAATTTAGLITNVMGIESKSITDISHDIAGVENHLIDVVLGHSAFPTGTAGHAWTMADETDFDTELAWAVPADKYIVHITSVRAGLAADSYAGLVWYHRLGTWCPLNGTLGSTRRFLEFGEQSCDDTGRRMDGIALRCQPATIGTVQAWRLG